MKRLATTAFALLLFASPGLATTPDLLLNGGTLDFDYVGAVNGSFASDGEIEADPEAEGTAATTYVLDGLDYLTVVGAVLLFWPDIALSGGAVIPAWATDAVGAVLLVVVIMSQKLRSKEV